MNRPGSSSFVDERQQWDVVVIGAGPAGAMAALQLAVPDLKLLLVDRAAFPRHKVCGCCLNGVALASLKKAGLGNVVLDLGARPLRRLLLSVEGTTAALPLASGYALSRKVFDFALAQAAVERGVTFLPGTHARLVEIRGDSWCLQLRDKSSVRTVFSKVVLCADGLGGDSLRARRELTPWISSRARIGVSTILARPPEGFRDGVISMAVGRHGYAGLVRLEDGSLNVAAALDAGVLSRSHGPSPLIDAIFREAGMTPLPDLSEARWKGTLPLTRRRLRLGDRRLLVLGDAAGYVEPFTGEGMAWALESGELVAPFVRAALESWSPGLLASWQRTYHRRFGRRHRVCRLLSGVLRHRPLYKCLIHLLSWNPSWAVPVLEGINRVEGKVGRKGDAIL